MPESVFVPLDQPIAITIRTIVIADSGGDFPCVEIRPHITLNPLPEFADPGIDARLHRLGTAVAPTDNARLHPLPLTPAHHERAAAVPGTGVLAAGFQSRRQHVWRQFATQILVGQRLIHDRQFHALQNRRPKIIQFIHRPPSQHRGQNAGIR